MKINFLFQLVDLKKKGILKGLKEAWSNQKLVAEVAVSCVQLPGNLFLGYSHDSCRKVIGC